MTRAIALTRLIEEAIYAESTTKNFTGAVANLAELIANIDALQRFHKGLFCFLAFHPAVDSTVRDYVATGALGSDSGKQILVLFLSGTDYRTPQAVEVRHLIQGITLDLDVHPAYRMVEWLFPADRRPVLPGLLLFDRLFDVNDAVYVPLAYSKDVQGLASLCRRLFVLMESLINASEQDGHMFDQFCATLRRDNVDYSRTSATSLHEWLISGIQFAQKHGSSIASAVGKVAKAL